MNRINFGRVLLGGIVAGLLMNLGEFILNGVVLHDQMQTDFKRMNLAPPGNSFLVVAVGLTFVFGIVAVLVYALMRTHLGPGPKTAIVVALIVWFCAAMYTGTINMVLLSVPAGTILLVNAWALVEYTIAVLVGAALYKEK